MQIANPPNWDLQNALNGSIPDLYIGRFKLNLRDFFEEFEVRVTGCVLRVASYSIWDCGLRISDCSDWRYGIGDLRFTYKR